MTGLASVIQFQETRERIQEHSRRTRRPFEIRAEERRLKARKGKPIFELMSAAELARLMDVAPTLMRDAFDLMPEEEVTQLLWRLRRD
ncbi:MAG: hypothetical protein LC795_15510 [Acidobacteria bacterium]|nr:hypothetical protein [Acidobacteriota bacterium]MCA1620683.1 hypothetical protein [Acidobacteriota bacterium]